MIKQQLVLYTFVIIGILLGKSKKGLSDKSDLLSFLVVKFLLPCKLFLNFSNNFTVSYLQTGYVTVFVSFGILAVLLAAGRLVSALLTRDRYEKKVFRYSTAVSNYAFFGYVLVEQALGEAAMNDLMVFCIPFSLYCYTFGVSLLMDKRVSPVSVLNPVTVSIFVGIIFGLTGLSLPEVFSQVLLGGSACVGPVSMVLVGLVISGFSAKELLPTGSVWAFCAVRLIALPGLVYGICRGLSAAISLPHGICVSAVIMAAMPCGLNTVVFPKLTGRDCSLGAKLIPTTALLSCATVPFWLWAITG